MKDNMLDKIENHINEKKNIPEEVKDKIDKKVFENVIITIIVMAYFLFINLGYLNISKEIFIMDLKVFSVSALIISIILFEKAYKKDSGKLAINGIEMLVLALITLSLPYTFFYLNKVYKVLSVLMGLIFAIYYLAKCIIIYIKLRNEYINSLSDIKEIVKKEKKKDKNKDTVEDKEEKTEVQENEKEVEKVKKDKKSSTKKVSKNTTKKDSTKVKSNTNKTKNTKTKKNEKTGDKK